MEWNFNSEKKIATSKTDFGFKLIKPSRLQ